MPAGYDVKFVHPLLKRHQCPLCSLAMRNPMQTECGHLFCRDCLEPVLKRRHPICPLDKEEITQEGTFPDNACRREILKLQVYCVNHNAGCQWMGPLNIVEDHVQACEYRDIQCTQCGQYIQQLILIVHKTEQCPMRPVKCTYCGKDIPHQQLQTHIDKLCTKVMHSCPNACDSSLKMNLQELEKHTDAKTGTCPLSEVECVFRAYGCTFISLRQNLETHLNQYLVYHAHIQAESFNELRLAVTKQNSTLDHILERVSGVETRINTVEQVQDRVEQRVEYLDDKRDHHTDINEGKLDNLEEQVSTNSSLLAQLVTRVDELEIKAVTGLTSGYNTSSTTGGPSSLPRRLNSTPLQGFGDVSSQRIDALHTRMVELEHSVDRALSSCLDQELRVQLLERATYNGVLLWKIDEFERRRREAVDGITMSLYSTPFYTNRHGYKMCARIYLNGDGMGKGTHLSFFFVIMRGPFDALLHWSFKQKVTLTLVNQEGKKHISDSFRPDANSSSFQRPGRREMNIASGCPMFIRTEQLLNGGFVKDDSIFVRVLVDTLDLPKVIP